MIDEYAQTQTETTPYESPMYMYGSTILQLTNPQAIIKEMELTLRNQEIVDNKIIKLGTPLMNDIGIRQVKGIVQGVVNQMNIMSNYDKKDIMMIMDYVNDTLARDLMIHKVQYGLNETTRDNVKFIVEVTCFGILQRAKDEGDRRFWKGSQKEVKSEVVGLNRGGGGLKSLLPFGRR